MRSKGFRIHPQSPEKSWVSDAAISYGSRKPYQERNFCRPTERKSEIYLATLASSCSASALEVARFLKIRNRELRFLLPEELWLGKSEQESRSLGIRIVPPLVGIDAEVTASKLWWHKPCWAAPRIFVSGQMSHELLDTLYMTVLRFISRHT